MKRLSDLFILCSLSNLGGTLYEYNLLPNPLGWQGDMSERPRTLASLKHSLKGGRPGGGFLGSGVFSPTVGLPSDSIIGAAMVTPSILL